MGASLMVRWIAIALVMVLGLVARPAIAAETVIPINLTAANGVGSGIGEVAAIDTDYGLLLTPALTDLPPGIHGFHVHTTPDCGAAEKDGETVPGLAAGGHFDPASVEQHLGPYAEGHLGDLPALTVANDGTATLSVLAPRLTVADLSGHSLMVHAGGDNYSDQPSPLGGGGGRTACGVIR